MRPSLSSPLLAVALLVGVPAAAQEAASPPWSTEGRIEDSDAQADTLRYDEYRLRLEAGSRYRISAGSEDFDTLIRLFQAGEPDPVAENDDFNVEQGLNSRITYTPEESAEYVLRVLTFSEEGRGAYTASAESLPPLPPPVTGRAADTARSRWQIWEGELAEFDPDRDGAHFDDYLVRMRAGETRLIMLELADFDTTLWVLRADGREGEPLLVNDDGGPGTNSTAAFQPEDNADYIVRASSYAPGGTGRYRLRVSDPVTPPPPPAWGDTGHVHD